MKIFLTIVYVIWFAFVETAVIRNIRKAKCVEDIVFYTFSGVVMLCMTILLIYTMFT